MLIVWRAPPSSLGYYIGIEQLARDELD